MPTQDRHSPNLSKKHDEAKEEPQLDDTSDIVHSSSSFAQRRAAFQQRAVAALPRSEVIKMVDICDHAGMASSPGEELWSLLAKTASVRALQEEYDRRVAVQFVKLAGMVEFSAGSDIIPYKSIPLLRLMCRGIKRLVLLPDQRGGRGPSAKKVGEELSDRGRGCRI